jgi:hypothetical protein
MEKETNKEGRKTKHESSRIIKTLGTSRCGDG